MTTFAVVIDADANDNNAFAIAEIDTGLMVSLSGINGYSVFATEADVFAAIKKIQDFGYATSRANRLDDVPRAEAFRFVVNFDFDEE